MSLRCRVRVPRGETVRVSFWTLVAPTREEAIDLADKHREPTAFDRVLALRLGAHAANRLIDGATTMPGPYVPGANQAPYRLFKDDGDSEYFTPSTGLVLMFPSYLEHFVLPNRSDDDRISMSFDLTLER